MYDTKHSEVCTTSKTYKFYFAHQFCGNFFVVHRLLDKIKLVQEPVAVTQIF